jgi:membrane protein DedA with SNARE-associated domain
VFISRPTSLETLIKGYHLGFLCLCSRFYTKEIEKVEYLNGFLDFLNLLPDFLIYFFLGLSAFVENVFPPIPGDTITAFGAFMVGTKRLHFFGVYFSTTLGSLAGFMFLFWVGGLLGRRFFIERNYWFFKAENIIRAEGWYRKYGYFLVLLNRFFPGIRSVISIAGGISKLRVLKVTWLALISCGVWNLIWITFGYMLGNNWETVRDEIAYIMVRYNFAILIMLGLLIIFFALRKVMKEAKGKRRRAKGK